MIELSQVAASAPHGSGLCHFIMPKLSHDRRKATILLTRGSPPSRSISQKSPTFANAVSNILISAPLETQGSAIF